MFSKKCPLCSEKDARIADLKEQITNLRSLVGATQVKTGLSFAEIEADSILSASVEPAELEAEQINNEAANLLTGAYDQAQVDVY